MKKAQTLASNANINPNVYYGQIKINFNDENFMTRPNVLETMISIKLKNSEGSDRIPKRIILYAAEILGEPLTVLMNKIYEKRRLKKNYLGKQKVEIW